MREIVFDTETTGLSFSAGDRLVEIGCVELVNRVETGRTFHAYYHPERGMPAEAFAVHGLSETFLSDKPVFAAGVAELLDFLEDAPLVAHNASFDFGFLNGELGRCGFPPVCTRTRYVDTLQIARGRHPGAKHSLDALCGRYGIDRSHPCCTARCSTRSCWRRSMSNCSAGGRSGWGWSTRRRSRRRRRCPAASTPNGRYGRRAISPHRRENLPPMPRS